MNKDSQRALLKSPQIHSTSATLRCVFLSSGKKFYQKVAKLLLSQLERERIKRDKKIIVYTNSRCTLQLILAMGNLDLKDASFIVHIRAKLHLLITRGENIFVSLLKMNSMNLRSCLLGYRLAGCVLYIHYFSTSPENLLFAFSCRGLLGGKKKERYETNGKVI